MSTPGLRKRNCPTCDGAGHYYYPGNPNPKGECPTCSGRGFEYIFDEHLAQVLVEQKDQEIADLKQAKDEPVAVTFRKFLEGLPDDGTLRLWAWWVAMNGYCRECGVKEPSHDTRCKYGKGAEA